MLLGGILVGAAGTILTILMCNAMNRSLLNVIIGGFSASSSSKESKEQGEIKEVSDSDFAVQLFYSNKVIVIPGYGLAVAQAQAGRSYLFDKVGDRLAEIRLPKGLWTTSVAFHPNNDRLLYIIDAEHASVFSCVIPV